MFKFSKIIISLFGIGFFPWASGTIGTFFSLVFFYMLFKSLSFFILIYIFIGIFIISLKLIKFYSITNKSHDSSEIIIDEFLGINFILIFYDYFKFTNDFSMFIIIFFVFRFFDIVKIFPANWIDKNMTNSWGVILDDIVAALYSVCLLYIINAYI